PYGRHIFVGGNTLVPAIIRDHAEELGTTAPSEAFDATIAAARDQLQHRTARLSVIPLVAEPERLRLRVDVESLVGHKFPTGHPTRRAWLQVIVRDGERVVFRSGDFDEAGRIVDRDGRVLPSERRDGPTAPHRDIVRTSSEVQIYETVMGDVEGRVTFGLMRAATPLKDNRLLPRGWSPDHPEAEATAPAGLDGDANFLGGGDRVIYDIALPAASEGATRTVEVSLLYQVLGARYAAELLRWETPEMRAFARYYESASKTPEVVATATIRVEPQGSRDF
ncbi:MAG: hypothetical protein KDC38_16220, partial [Planctomycetes bacterium]|nr:hypothetical protein [Planctomycetota bacterium]